MLIPSSPLIALPLFRGISQRYWLSLALSLIAGYWLAFLPFNGSSPSWQFILDGGSLSLFLWLTAIGCHWLTLKKTFWLKPVLKNTSSIMHIAFSAMVICMIFLLFTPLFYSPDVEAEVAGVVISFSILLSYVAFAPIFRCPMTYHRLRKEFSGQVSLVVLILVAISLYSVINHLFGYRFSFLALPLYLWFFRIPNQSISALASFIMVLVTLGLLCNSNTIRHDWIDSQHSYFFHIEICCYLLAAFYLTALKTNQLDIESKLEEQVLKRTKGFEAANLKLAREITIRKHAERSFYSSFQRYRSIIDTAASPILVLNEHCQITQWNRAAARLFNQTQGSFIGKNYIEHYVPVSYHDETAWKIKKVIETGQKVENFECEIIDSSQNKQFMLWNISRIDQQVSKPQVVLVGQNISSIRETQDQLHFLAHYDALTGAANRRLFEDRCTQALKQVERNQSNIGLISLDIDHFKKINDTLGHDIGDALLKEIVKRLRASVREEDTIARLGGDEFAILLCNVKGEEGCLRVGRSVLKSITEPVQLDDQQLDITTSLGVTVAPKDGKNYDQLLKNADMAMYRAKQAGRNRLRVYKKDMNAELERLISTEADLKTAIDQQQFDLYYQPLVDIKNHQVIGMEALLRWYHPQRGILEPKDFIEIAERCGLLAPLGNWIIYNACLQARAIQTMSNSPIQISVNISTRQLYHPSFIDTLQQALSETRVDPALFCLEIDEPSLLQNSKEAEHIVNKIRALEVGITIDSFGSGLSSVASLARLPVRALKIDRTLTQNIPGEEHEEAIMETLLAIASRMNIKVIVEGVEYRKQEAFLSQHGVLYAQGHYYSRPIPSSDLPQFFSDIRATQSILPPQDLHLIKPSSKTSSM